MRQRFVNYAVFAASLLLIFAWACGGGGGSDRQPAQQGSQSVDEGPTQQAEAVKIENAPARVKEILDRSVWNEPRPERDLPEIKTVPTEADIQRIKERSDQIVLSGKTSMNPAAMLDTSRDSSSLAPQDPWGSGQTGNTDPCCYKNDDGTVVDGVIEQGQYRQYSNTDVGSVPNESFIGPDKSALITGGPNRPGFDPNHPDFYDDLANRYSFVPSNQLTVPFGYNDSPQDSKEDLLQNSTALSGTVSFPAGFAYEYNPERPSGTDIWPVGENDFVINHHFDRSIGGRGILSYIISGSQSDPRASGDASYGSNPGQWYTESSSAPRSAISTNYIEGGGARVQARMTFNADYNESGGDLLENYHWGDVLPAPAANTSEQLESYEAPVGPATDLTLNVTEMYSYASTEYRREAADGDSENPAHPDATDLIIDIEDFSDASQPLQDFLGNQPAPQGGEPAFPVVGLMKEAYAIHAQWSQADSGADPWESSCGPPVTMPTLRAGGIIDPNRRTGTGTPAVYTEFEQLFMKCLIRVRKYNTGPHRFEYFETTDGRSVAASTSLERSEIMRVGDGVYAPISYGGHDGNFPLNVRVLANSGSGLDQQGNVNVNTQAPQGAGVTLIAVPSGGGSDTNRDPLTDIIWNLGDGTAIYNDRDPGGANEDWEEFRTITHNYPPEAGNIEFGNLHPQVMVLEDPDGDGDPDPVFSGTESRNFALANGPRVKLSGSEALPSTPVAIITPFPINDATSNDLAGGDDQAPPDVSTGFSGPHTTKSVIGDIANTLEMAGIDFGNWPMQTDTVNGETVVVDPTLGVGITKGDREICGNADDHAVSPGNGASSFDCGSLLTNINNNPHIYQMTDSGQLTNNVQGAQTFSEALSSYRMVITAMPHNVEDTDFGGIGTTTVVGNRMDTFETQIQNYLQLRGQRSFIAMCDGNCFADYRYQQAIPFNTASDNSRVGYFTKGFVGDWLGVEPPGGSLTSGFNVEENTNTYGSVQWYQMSGNFLSAKDPIFPDPPQTKVYYNWQPQDGSAYSRGSVPQSILWDRFDFLMSRPWSGGSTSWFGGIYTPFDPSFDKPIGLIRSGYLDLSLINTRFPTQDDQDFNGEDTDDGAGTLFASGTYPDFEPNLDAQDKKADYLERILLATDSALGDQLGGTQFITDSTVTNSADSNENTQPEEMNVSISITGVFAERFDTSQSGTRVEPEKGSGRSLSATEFDPDQAIDANIVPGGDPSQATAIYEIAFRSDRSFVTQGLLDDPSSVHYRIDANADGSFNLGNRTQPIKLQSPTLKAQYTAAVQGNIDQDNDGRLEWEADGEDGDGDGNVGEKEIALGAPAFVRGQVAVSDSLLTGFDDTDSGNPLGADSSDFYGDDPEPEHNTGTPPTPASNSFASNTLVDNDDVCVEIDDDGSAASDPSDADWCVFYRINTPPTDPAWTEYDPEGTALATSTWDPDASNPGGGTGDCLRVSVTDPGGNAPAAIANQDGECMPHAVSGADVDHLTGAIVQVDSQFLPLNLESTGPESGGDVSQGLYIPDADTDNDNITVEWSISGGQGPYDLEFFLDSTSGRRLVQLTGVSQSGSTSFDTEQSGCSADDETVCNGSWTIVGQTTDNQGETDQATWDFQGGEFNVGEPPAIIVNDTSSGPTGNAEVDAYEEELSDIFGTTPDVRNTDANVGDPIDSVDDFGSAKRVFWAVDEGDTSGFNSDEESALSDHIADNGTLIVLTNTLYASNWTGDFESLCGGTVSISSWNDGSFASGVVHSNTSMEFFSGNGGSLGNSGEIGQGDWGSSTAFNPHGAFGFAFGSGWEDSLDEPTWGFGGTGYVGGSSVNGGCGFAATGQFSAYGDAGSAGTSGEWDQDMLHNAITDTDNHAGLTTP